MANDTTYAERLGGPESRLSGWRLDGVVTALSVLMIAGVALDFRRHAQGISFAEEGFLTVEHVFFYSMFLAIAAVIGSATYRNRRSGADWIRAVPTGYGWGVVGVLLFGFGGAGDFLWHSAFGFEEGIEGLTSPSHLALATGASLFLASPLRAAWYRDWNPDARHVLPAVVSTSLVLTIVALFGAFLNPLTQATGVSDSHVAQIIGVSSLMVFPLVFVGTTLTLARRFDLTFGSFVLAFLPAGAASILLGNHVAYLAPVAFAGLVADGLVARYHPLFERTRAIRAVGALVPLAFCLTYFGVVAAGPGIAWTVHIWTGAVTMATLAGLLLTYAVAPDGGVT